MENVSANVVLSSQRDWHTDRPVTLATAMDELEQQVSIGDVSRFHRLATGFKPLDDVLNGGIAPGEFLILGGPFGVGKTIFGLQLARNVVREDPETWAVYVCYEHDASHLLQRLLCMESSQAGRGGEALTLRKLAQLAEGKVSSGLGLISRLRQMPRHGQLLAEIDRYAERLILIRAGGSTGTLERLAGWVDDVIGNGRRVLLVVDYLQKIPLGHRNFVTEDEATVYLAQGVKELAISRGIQIVAIAASDRLGLKAKRMRLTDLRGGSALQYECDIGMVLNNKWDIVSREHLVYNVNQAADMRNWVVMSIEKNRAGLNAVDMEYALDAAHFRIDPAGGFVRERLVDERVVMA